jgi:putative membrane protein insertion efficiency factor
MMSDQTQISGRATATAFRTIASELTYALIQTFKTVFLMQNAVCRFEPSCSIYAKESVKTLPFHKAAIKIIWRILRCSPFSKGGYDPVTIERR